MEALLGAAGAVAGSHERPGRADDEKRIGAGLAAERELPQDDERLPAGVACEVGQTVVGMGHRQGSAVLGALHTTLEGGSTWVPTATPAAE